MIFQSLIQILEFSDLSYLFEFPETEYDVTLASGWRQQSADQLTGQRGPTGPHCQ